MIGDQLGKQDLEKLRAEFSDEQLSVKVQALNKERTRAMLIVYVQHNNVQERLEQVDPNWCCRVVEEKTENETTYVRMRLTIKGVTRENVGEGQDPKAALSDALKRCASLFGVGRYLYNMQGEWVAYDEKRDRFRKWTIDDYRGRGRAEASAREDRDPAAAPPARGSRARVVGRPPQSAPPPRKAALPPRQPARSREEQLGDYIIPVGSLKGAKLAEVSPDELLEQCEFFYRLQQEGKAISRQSKEFLARAEEWIALSEETEGAY